MKQKSALETELKLRIHATGDHASRLAAIGFRLAQPAQPEASTLWDRNGELQAAGSALRTRSYAGQSRLTWKGPRVPDTLLKIRPERETGIDDAAALEAILRALGFAPFMHMEKVRSVWERSDLEACLDETPFGCYLELEGEPGAIRTAMEALGLTAESAEPRSYPELFRANGLGSKPDPCAPIDAAK